MRPGHRTVGMLCRALTRLEGLCLSDKEGLTDTSVAAIALAASQQRRMTQLVAWGTQVTHQASTHLQLSLPELQLRF